MNQRLLTVVSGTLIVSGFLVADPPQNDYEEIAMVKNVFKIEDIGKHAKSFNFSNTNSVPGSVKV